MNIATKIWTSLAEIARHPVNRNRKFKSVLEYGFVQVAARLVPGDLCLPLPNQMRLLISPHMKGAAHYILPGLCEFDEMSFVMHFLRPEEYFIDVGANVGSYSVMAAGVAGARGVAFEPSREVYQQLERNIRLNGLADRVRTVNAAVGRMVGSITFSTGLGTENHIRENMAAGDGVATPLTTLDAELAGITPVLMKVDVEGFESEVMAGAIRTLANPGLAALVMERNGSGNRYGFDEEKLHEQIRASGFKPCTYRSLERKLTPVADTVYGNIMYVRDVETAAERLRTARPYKFKGLEV